jgi:hypothetical protein
MMDRDPRILLGIGFVLMLLGVILPILMIMKLLVSTFFLNFFSYGASLVGLFLGMLGVMSIVARSRNRRR